MSSQDKFVDQVAKTIVDNHNKKGSEASFIFGISGKWGEGKTVFLENLEPKLLEKGFTVAWINPWKFASDRTSFLRSFLKQLSRNTKKKKGKFGKLRDFINNRNEFRNLDYDVSEIHVHYGWLLIIILFLLIATILYLNYEILLGFIPPIVTDWIIGHLTIIKAVASTGIIATVISILGKTIFTQRSNKSISTLDGFDSLLKQILSESKSEKVCVFVDDLDRVTPQIARVVLDNLRTFFDIPKLTFVVTGDHTVLERYIGEQTLPNKTESEQLEEGRRFLKKIFDVYWRLPRPILNDFKAALNNIYIKRDGKLKKIFKTDVEREKLQTYFANYFDKNYREVIRFLDKIIFTFQIIDTQRVTATDETKKYYEEMYKKPLLVVRVLMFEELCSPYFEEIVRNSQLLKDMERAVVLNDDDGLNSNIEKFNTIIPNSKVHKLSPDQERFLRKFIKEEPRFYKGRSWDVYSITPYLSLAADSGMGDERGSLPEDFVAELKLGDSELTKTNLENSGEKSIKGAASATMNLIQSTTDLTEKSGYLTTILTALRGSSDSVNQKPFLEDFKSIDLSAFTPASSPVRLQVYDLFWKWLDKQADIPNEYYDKFPLQNNADLNSLNTDAAGIFSTKILTMWLWGYYAGGNADALEKMVNIFPKLDAHTVRHELNPNIDVLINTLLSAGEVNMREDRYLILVKFTTDGAKRLREEVFNKIRQHDDAAWDWITAKAESGDESNKSIWSREELTEEVYKLIRETNDITTSLTYSKNKIPNNSDELWDIILNSQTENFVNSLPVIIPSGSYNSYLPSTKYAERLFVKIIEKINTLGDDEKVQWLPYLNKNIWLWSNLGDMPRKKQINSWEKSENEGVKNSAMAVVQSWSPQDENQSA